MTPYCYVVGTARSGSTLLSRMLHAHPEIGTTGEMNGPNRKQNRGEHRCSCGSRITHCSFFLQLHSGLRTLGLHADLDRWSCVFTLEEDWFRHRHVILNRLAMHSLRSDLLDGIRDRLLSRWKRRQRALERAGRASAAYAQIGLELLGARRVWVDATKEPIRLRHLLHRRELDVYAVHLVRDPRGYCLSMQKSGQADWSRSARQWVWNARNALRVLRRMPEERRITLRYETLVEHPVTSVNAVARLVGARTFDSYDFQASGHHLIGNRMRLGPLSELKHDERWKSELSRRAIKDIGRITSSYARRYGYDF